MNLFTNTDSDDAMTREGIVRAVSWLVGLVFLFGSVLGPASFGVADADANEDAAPAVSTLDIPPLSPYSISVSLPVGSLIRTMRSSSS